MEFSYNQAKTTLKGRTVQDGGIGVKSVLPSSLSVGAASNKNFLVVFVRFLWPKASRCPSVGDNSAERDGLATASSGAGVLTDNVCAPLDLLAAKFDA